MPIVLNALTLRLACDEQNRIPVTPLDADRVVLYRNNPTSVQCAIFDGPVSATTLVDLTGVRQALLTIRDGNSRRPVVIEADTSDINATILYADWVSGANEHFKFDLSAAQTNIAIPSYGERHIYGTIILVLGSGDSVVVGTFEGVISESGLADVGVNPPFLGLAAPFLYISEVDSYVGSLNSLDNIDGGRLRDGTLLVVIINDVESSWRVTKPATETTDVDSGIIRLVDDSAHLTRVSGL